MIKKTLKRLKRAPVPAVAVLLFAAVVSTIVCALHASNEAEMQHYEEALQSIPVTVTVTDPSEIHAQKYFLVEDWVYYLFTGKNTVELFDTSSADNVYDALELMRKGRVDSIKLSLAEYVKDVQVKASRGIKSVGGITFKKGAPSLCGITSISCDKQLLPEYGCVITWKEGYDENIFGGEEAVCIVPEDIAENYGNDDGEVVLDFNLKLVGGGKVESYYEYQCTLKIVGTYTGGDEKSIYCPYPIFEQVSIGLDDNEYPTFDSLSATIADNRRLEEFREKASICFLEPSPEAERIRWGCFVNNWYCDFYDYALDINDENLQDLAVILEDSIKFNRTVTVFVVILSVVSGFLVGFLMIRRRKRDIILMRTVGDSNFGVYSGFVLEQMICIILGIALGGAYNRWEPIDKLLIFAIVYFVGLTIALVIFLNKKLLTTIKEDE